MKWLAPLTCAFAVTLLAQPSLANRTGQFDYSGRAASCLNCHGPTSYDGLNVTVDGLGSPIKCWVADSTAEGGIVARDIATLDYSGTATVTVSITNPGDPNAGGADSPTCPDTDCCAGSPDPGPDSICGQATFSVNGVSYQGPRCTNFLHVCEDTAVAGFNAEAEGGGAFTIAEADLGTRMKYPGNGALTQVSHAEGHDFLTGDATWSFTYTAPSAEEYTDGINLWVGANIANHNGYADDLDLNSNYVVAVAVADNLPSYCAVCDDGSAPDDTGNCGGCGCSAQDTSMNPSEGALLGGLFMAGMLLRRRRRG